MTTITTTELKLIAFGFFFTAILGVFFYFYSQTPPVNQVYSGQTEVSVAVSATSASWISSLINSTFPAPFNDPIIILITGIFIVPITILLGMTAIRYAKDIFTQWV